MLERTILVLSFGVDSGLQSATSSFCLVGWVVFWFAFGDCLVSVIYGLYVDSTYLLRGFAWFPVFYVLRVILHVYVPFYTVHRGSCLVFLGVFLLAVYILLV